MKLSQRRSRAALALVAAAATAVTLGIVNPSSAAVTPPPTALEDPIPALIPFDRAAVDLKQVATGLASPVAASVAPGHEHSLFVADQTGQIWDVTVDGRGGKRLFADLSSRLVPLGLFGIAYDERGLLGLAFDPGFARTGKFYTYTSEPAAGPADFTTPDATGVPGDPGGAAAVPYPAGGDVGGYHQSVISEWRVKQPGAERLTFDPSSRRELFRIDKPQFNHNGGALAFGPDGNLYISVGDGGQADDLARGHAAGGNGQSLAPGNVLGKVLRIDPRGRNSRNGRYGIPATNPRTGGEPEIFAYGFRNPFRMSFDSRTGALYVGDVGQNDVEEVDVVQAGRNYGWPVKEGTFLFANRDTCDPAHGKGCVFQDSPGAPAALTDPLAEYDHTELPDTVTEIRVAVIGGYVYRGSELDALKGRYVFGDYSGEIGTPVAGHLFTLNSKNKVVEIKVPSRTGADGKTALGLAVLGFAQDAKGELYLLGNGSGTLADPGSTTVPGSSGGVFKLVPARG